MTYSCGIATPHVLATAAAREAVERGGNSVDAALAAAAVLAVVYPHNTALGGDLVALIRTPDGRIACVNATGPAPRGVSRQDLAARYGDMPVTGPDTITVPGVAAGWAALHEAGAALAWPAHFTRAIEHAAATPVVRGLAEAIAGAADLIAADPGMRAVFSPGGTPLAEGGTLRQEALAGTLSTLADQGVRALYAGSVGERLAGGLRRLGSPIDTGDLRAYQAELTTPLSRTFDGHRIHTSPPNTQGLLLLQALGALAEQQVDDPLGTGAGRLATIFHHGILDRTRHLGDPRFADIDVAALLDPARLRHLAPAASPAATGRASGDTVAVVAADTDGFAVSLIQSLFDGFGAGILESGTGILMHNRGSFFSLSPGSPNVLAPGKRPAHTLMPVMATRAKQLAWVNGTMGGKAQPQIHAQLLLRLLGGDGPADAVAAPRWIVGGLELGQPEDTISMEADVAAPARASLAATGAPRTELPALSEWAGHAQSVAVHQGGALEAGSDPRSDGSAVVAIR
ncbi:MAG: Gamma-glutamyltransferase [Streptosporangiaceae bacterium]|jgi:gamma-glutamyltranspeptidase/glutathione hydrolase|nr:Gamma-glutamyltransferase [Streptosporangiaceae bacterium]